MTDAGSAMVQPDASQTDAPARVETTRCPACGGSGLDVFFQQHDVPVTSNVSFRSREEALAVARGDLRLAFCHGCGMVMNVAYEEQPLGEEIETSQAASSRFQEYANEIARRWIERHGLEGETVLEIGCARGEFLNTMVAQGAGRGIGVDPVLANPDAPRSTEAITYVGDVFRAEHLDDSVRAIVCRHTLEHIYETRTFLDRVRSAIGERDIVVLFEVPDAERVLRDAEFHDIYYEHCSYFATGSLERLFRRTGFDVLGVQRTFSGQYLVIEARPGAPAADEPPTGDDDRARLWQQARAFGEGYAERLGQIEGMLRESARLGERVVFWGAGSKATSLVTSLSSPEWVDCVVDINPRKWGTYIAGTGHAVVAPEHLTEARPDVVVLMNPAYRVEVGRMLDELGVAPRLIGPDGDA